MGIDRQGLFESRRRGAFLVKLQVNQAEAGKRQEVARFRRQRAAEMRQRGSCRANPAHPPPLAVGEGRERGALSLKLKGR